MVPDTWSINRLACELQMDRRVLGKKLAGLTPAKESRNGNRTERLYYLASVIAHLSDPEGVDLDLNVERAKLARLQQEKLKLDLGEARGELVRMPLVEQHWIGMVANVRAKLLALPNRLAAQVAGPDRIQEVQNKAQALVYEALEEIAGDGIPEETRRRANAQAEAEAIDEET